MSEFRGPCTLPAISQFLATWGNPQLQLGAQLRRRILPLVRVLKWPTPCLNACMAMIAHVLALLEAATILLTGHMAVSALTLSTSYSSAQRHCIFLLCFLPVMQHLD